MPLKGMDPSRASLRSYLSVLRPVCLHALGPQQSLAIIRTDDAEGDDVVQSDGSFADDAHDGTQPGDESVWSAKSHAVLRSLGSGSALSALLVDVCESFGALWGTGTSSLAAWVVLFVEHLLEREGTGAGAGSRVANEDMAARLADLEEVEALYVAMAQALAFCRLPYAADALDSGAGADWEAGDAGAGAEAGADYEAGRGPECSSGDDGTSWFFLSDDSPGGPDDVLAALLLQQDRLLREMDCAQGQGRGMCAADREREGGMEAMRKWEREWEGEGMGRRKSAEPEWSQGDDSERRGWAVGQEGTLGSDTQRQGGGRGGSRGGAVDGDVWLARGLQHSCSIDYPHETTRDGVTLPMQLAATAAHALRGGPISSASAAAPASASASASATVPDDGIADEVYCTAQSVRARVHAVLLPGVRHDHSRAIVNGLVFRAEAQVLGRLGLSVPASGGRRQAGPDSSRQTPLQSLQSASPCVAYRRCLVVDAEVFDPGTGQGAGASAPPSGSSTLQVLSAASAALSGHTLLDPTHAASIQFSPAALYRQSLAEAVSRLQLNLLMCLDSALTIEMLDCLPCAVIALPARLLRHAAAVAGCDAVGDLLDADHDSCGRHAVRCSAMAFQDTQSQHVLLQLERRSSCRDDANEAGEAGEAGETGDAGEVGEEGCACVSVIVCAPTAAQCRATTDRFWRSLSRLHHLSNSPVLPGGGLCELLVAMHIDERASRGDRRLAGWAPVMRKFVATVLANSGHSLTECSGALEGAAKALTRLLRIAEPCVGQSALPAAMALHMVQVASGPFCDNESETVLAAVQRLSDADKASALALGPMLLLAPGDVHVLDVCGVRVGAMRAAVSAVQVMCGGSIRDW